MNKLALLVLILLPVVGVAQTDEEDHLEEVFVTYDSYHCGGRIPIAKKIKLWVNKSYKSTFNHKKELNREKMQQQEKVEEKKTETKCVWGGTPINTFGKIVMIYYAYIVDENKRKELKDSLQTYNFVDDSFIVESMITADKEQFAEFLRKRNLITEAETVRSSY